MNKIGKYKLKFAVRMFQILEEWLEESNYSMDDVYDDSNAVQDLYVHIERTLALGDQDDIEFFIAAFYENYKACDGNWEILGDGVPPVTPQKQTWVIEQNYKQISIVYERAKTETYMPSIIKWDAYESNLDWDIYDEDVRDTYDYDFDDVYVED